MKNIYEKPVMTYWTAEKLNKIAARMSGGDGDGAELGSSRWNPMYLTSGQIGTLSFQDCWFQCEIDGAVDFRITATDEFEVKVYRNNLAPYNLFREWTSQDHTVDECVSVYQENDGINKYMINIIGTSELTVACRVKQHIDLCRNSNGSLWTPNADSAVPNTGAGNCNLYWYIPKEHIHAVKYYLNNAGEESILSNSQTVRMAGEAAASQAISLAASFLGSAAYGGIAGVGVGLIATAILYVATSWLDMQLDKNIIPLIEENSGYDLLSDSYTNGVLIKKNYFARTSSLGFFRVEPWSEDIMSGAIGWTGNFDVRHLDLLYTNNE